MNIKEFSDRFDTLLNSFGNTPNIVLDEYEKSVLLTNAQEDLVLSMYNGKNPFNDSFETNDAAMRLIILLWWIIFNCENKALWYLDTTWKIFGALTSHKQK